MMSGSESYGPRMDFLRASAWAFAFCFATSSAHAFIPSRMGNGTAIKHRGTVARLDLAGNPKNQSGLTDAQVFQSFTRPLQRWNEAANGSVEIRYWQGSDSSVFEPNSEYNGISSVYFSSNANSDPGLGSGVIGLTQVWYRPDSGEILETDMVFNDQNYIFSTNVRDSSQPSSGFPTGRVFLENVVTHEMGHALGLSHSPSMQSTMLFVEASQQAFLACDDKTAIHHLYPSGDFGSRAGIQGSVISQSGAPIFGAMVTAISRRRGVSLGSAVTDKSGFFTISSLEPDTYFLLIEPFLASPTVLSDYYRDVSTLVCSGKSFGRFLLTEADGLTPRSFVAQAGETKPVGAITAVCSGGASWEATFQTASGAAASSTAPVIYTGPGTANPVGGFGFSNDVGQNATTYYKVKSVAGSVRFSAIGFSLYSDRGFRLNLINSSGVTVATSGANPSFTGASGFRNWDATIVKSGLPLDDYTIQIEAFSVESRAYPASWPLGDQTSFLILTGSLNESAGALVSSLPENPRCESADATTAYVSPDGLPPRKDTSFTPKTGFCGSVRQIHENGGRYTDKKLPPWALKIQTIESPVLQAHRHAAWLNAMGFFLPLLLAMLWTRSRAFRARIRNRFALRFFHD
ncbi:MAG: matrixin family metalloprotease [Bdellovibrionales bacterium]|nr:matrixin family metalloprotease [Bdellovibrionales bacterium]